MVDLWTGLAEAIWKLEVAGLENQTAKALLIQQCSRALIHASGIPDIAFHPHGDKQPTLRKHGAVSERKDIDQAFWAKIHRLSRHPAFAAILDWESGQLGFDCEIDMEESALKPGRYRECYSAIMLDRIALDDFVSRTRKKLVRQKPTAIQTMPPVSQAKLQRWFKGLGITHDWSEQRLIDSAKLAFPNYRVSRSQVRLIRGPQKRGRKSNQLD